MLFGRTRRAKEAAAAEILAFTRSAACTESNRRAIMAELTKGTDVRVVRNSINLGLALRNAR